MADDRPNMVIVISDQHNPHVAGYAGDPVVRTPSLDRLASRGTNFASAYAASPLCVPSRMSLLTGQHPSSTQVWTNSCVLGSDVPTFAHGLAAEGYETVLCGRMHFMGPDQWHGFETRLVGDVIGTYFGGRLPDFGPVPLAAADEVREAVELAGPGLTSYQAYDRDVARAAIDFLKKRGRPDGPFCLVVGFVLPHCPYIAPPSLYDDYAERVAVPDLPPGYHDRLHPAMKAWRRDRRIDDLDPDDMHRARAAYYALVELLDRNVGTVLDAAAPKDRPTHVVYTSDHGDMAGEHHMWWKSNLCEGAAGVPLLWAEAGATPSAAQVVDAPVSLVDLAPTLLDTAGAPPLPNADGRSLAAAFGRGALMPVDVFSEAVPARSAPARMVRRGPWKLVKHHGYETPQLFNLDHDPGEFHDRADAGDCAEVRAELVDAVEAGWRPGETLDAVARRRSDRAVLASAYAARPQPDPHYWVPPANSNVIPQWSEVN